jgi:tetratricopeptide (TPR) repeat protein
VLYHRGDLERALTELGEAAKEGPLDAPALLLVGNAADRLNKPDRAESAWRDALKQDPSNVEARFRLAKLLLYRGRAADALVELRKVAGGVPEKAAWQADFYFELGEAERTKGTRPAAVIAYRRYLELALPDAPARHEVERRLRELP